MSPYSSLALSSTSTIPLNPTARVPVHFACGHNPPHTRGGSAFPPRSASSKRRRRDVPAVPADEPVPPLSLAIKRQLMNLLSGHYAGVERAREEQRAGRRGGRGSRGRASAKGCQHKTFSGRFRCGSVTHAVTMTSSMTAHRPPGGNTPPPPPPPSALRASATSNRKARLASRFSWQLLNGR